MVGKGKKRMGRKKNDPEQKKQDINYKQITKGELTRPVSAFFPIFQPCTLTK